MYEPITQPRKLKICHVTSMHDWNDDRIFERACVGLATLGHEVTYIAQADNNSVVEGVKVIAIPRRQRLGKHLLGPWEAISKMIRIKADVYHFYNPNLMIPMAIWALLGKKVFVDIHENYESRVAKTGSPFFNNLAIKLYRRLENFMCSFYSGVTVVTDSMKQKLDHAGVPILVVDNVPYLHRLKNVHLATVKHQAPTIITSGSHSPARNCMKAIEAMPYILKEVPGTRMIFAGRFQTPAYLESLKKKASDLGIADKVDFEGMLPWLDSFTRISHSHIGCVFYEDNLNNRVTLPNRLYEYMYCGLAVLGQDFPEVKKVLDASKGGLTVDSNNERDIAEKAIMLLKDRQKLGEAGANARNAVINEFNFENALVRLEAFYFNSL